MTCQDSFHEVAFNISFWTRNISSARILFWRGVSQKNTKLINLAKFIACIFKVLINVIHTTLNRHHIIVNLNNFMKPQLV